MPCHTIHRLRHRAPPPSRLFALALALLIVTASAAASRAQPATSDAAPTSADETDNPSAPISIGLVDLDSLPGLRAYLRKTGYLAPDSVVRLFRTGPVSKPAATGLAPRAIYALQFEDLANCGSLGCTQLIIRQEHDGAFTLYDERAGGDLQLLGETTRGMHDLTSRTNNGLMIGRYNGTKYLWSRLASDEKKAADPTEPAALPAEIAGPCIDDRAWHGYAAAADGGAAGYGLCRTNRSGNFLLFECTTSAPDIAVTANVTTGSLQDSAPVTMQLTIDGSTFTLSGTGYYDVMTGVVLPRIDPLPIDTPLLEALATGRQASYALAGRRKTLHLDGAPEAIALMRAACTPPRG
ncbi:hypothetical protein [Pseudohoeflea coraliihabitans]|uniref:Uncharacterized protein n=1 Tax=Pseudohoeflea coraliihabitans TaxID=2860393 RepID=A0ABS6WKP8_9HYPH|nr:hypothetical protein [Pseudohoeflea sp. DP4N28-3]MBW3095715.1 hypothetical protein [Pseudohoeflea sp. DP4N28-3]